jgi:Bacteriocin-protection, YdeI or OmpD-Associated/Domain of unknown function (DUF1905)
MTIDFLSFEGRVETVFWGRAAYTVLPVPDEVAQTLIAQGAKRVEGEINEHPVNLALTRAPVVDGVFLWAGKSLLKRIGLSPGELAEVRLRPAPDDAVELAADIRAALLTSQMLAVWDQLTPGKQRGLLYQIDTAKTAPTRAKRIAKLVSSLAGTD